MQNREIKFRLWDSDLGMEYSPKFGGMGNDLNNQLKNALGILMQYTGLKDKNGKEIYEGDIIQYEQQWWDIGMHNIGMHKEVVSWNSDSSYAHFAAGDWSVEPEEVEIIGNIYENPELLTNNK